MSDNARKRVELSIAVAQERLLSTHVDHALDLISLVDDDVSFTDALEIYSRLLRLDEDQAQNISTRALAVLGERAEREGTFENPPREPTAKTTEEPVAEEEGEAGRSLFGQLKSRLRGRVHGGLRSKIELVAARTEVALIRTHVDNALHFVDILEGEKEERKAVELYLDALDVRESIAEVTYYLALSRLADDVLPEHGSGIAASRPDAGLGDHDEVAGRLHAR